MANPTKKSACLNYNYCTSKVWDLTGCLHAQMGQARHCKKRGTTCIFCSWQKSPYWHPGRRRHIIPIWNWVGGGGSILPARVCPHLSSPDEGGARARANTKVHSKPAITWVLSLVCPPKCQAHYIEHRYTYIPKVYTTHIYGELCSKSCNFTAQFSSTNKCKCT